MKSSIDEIMGSGTFSLVDHSISHNQFLYRGQSGSGLNKDILISGCTYLSIPIHLTDFRIYKGKSEDEEIAFNRYDSREEDKSVFVIVDKRGFKHYLVADRILTQENDYEGLETSIPIKREEPMSTNDIQELANRIKSEINDRGTQFVIDKYIQTGDWEILE